MAFRPVELHPEALGDSRSAYSWYFERNPSAAAAFLEELDRAVEEITAAPERWPHFLHGTRRFVLRRYPFSVVYRLSGTTIQIIAFAHGRRRPGYWRTR